MSGVILHQTTPFDRADRTIVEGIPVTSIARTLVDLGAVVDDDKVEQALDDALRRGTSLRWIVDTLDRLERPGPSGSASLRRVLDRPDRQGPIPDSTFERLVERAVTAIGMLQPERQIPVHDDAGQLIGRIDTGWRRAQLGLEAHSARWHTGIRRERLDQRRHTRLVAAGWEVMYVTWWDVQHPAEFVASVVSAYHRRLALFAA